MPDGRVLVAGSGEWNGSAPGEKTMQYYSPGYLFNGPRPTITSAPATMSYGSSMTLGTPDAAGVASVVLMGLPSVTHTTDWNQRFLPLSFTAGSGSLNVQTPTGPTMAPPGVYTVVIVNQAGVPSVGKIVRIGSAAIPAGAAGMASFDDAVARTAARVQTAVLQDLSSAGTVAVLARAGRETRRAPVAVLVSTEATVPRTAFCMIEPTEAASAF
jgi:hypothetical protein